MRKEEFFFGSKKREIELKGDGKRELHGNDMGISEE